MHLFSIESWRANVDSMRLRSFYFVKRVRRCHEDFLRRTSSVWACTTKFTLLDEGDTLAGFTRERGNGESRVPATQDDGVKMISHNCFLVWSIPLELSSL
jgi:hypothetical protein